MKERLDSALDHWRFKRKDEAFAGTLNCIAYLSSGLAGMAKLTEVMRSDSEELMKRVAALEGKQEGKQP